MSELRCDTHPGGAAHRGDVGLRQAVESNALDFTRRRVGKTLAVIEGDRSCARRLPSSLTAWDGT